MSSEKTKKKCGFLRILWRIVLVLLCIIVGLLVFILAGGLGPTVKYVGVPIANKLGIPLSIEKCVILPLGGYVCIEGLQVDNPKSFIDGNAKVYKETPLARLGKFEADFAMRSLFTDEYCVDTIHLSGVRALYAFDMDTTNVDALLLQMGVDKSAPAEPPTEAPAVETPAEETPPADAKPIKFRLAYVNIEDNSVTIRKFVSLPIPLPPLTLHDVDNETLVEKVESLIKPVISTVQTAGKGIGSGVEMLGDGAAAVTDGVLKVGSGTLDVTTETLGEGAKALEEGAKAIGDGLKSLFGD